MTDFPATFSRSQISFGYALARATLLLSLLSLILFLEVSAPAQTTATDLHHDTQIAGIAGKFCDYYSRAPSNEGTFILGSSIRQDLFDDGIEQIRIICPDGFVKIFWIAPETKRKVVNIDTTGKTTAVIHYSDGSDSTSEIFLSPYDRPITYQVIRKKITPSP